MATADRRTYETLDAVVVVGSLVIVGAAIGALCTLKIPDNNLPILAGLLGTLVGTMLGGYAGFRWGASVSGKDSAAVVAQLAGAGAPPPASPLTGEPEPDKEVPIEKG